MERNGFKMTGEERIPETRGSPSDNLFRYSISNPLFKNKFREEKIVNLGEPGLLLYCSYSLTMTTTNSDKPIVIYRILRNGVSFSTFRAAVD